MLRPSGVSSAIDACMALVARAASSTPGAGKKAEAWRLPWVMVPVLSSSSTSTSPAASTARPEVAITLACIMRLMPATPTADSKPPMVVGIKHTSRAIRAVMLTTVPDLAASTLKMENGNNVTVTTRNTIVSATSKIVSAISFGVLARLAPSTMLIMRSRKDSPGLTTMRTTSQSDSTRVPPVTAEKSPPDSRTTGADSPVMALSSTVATPSITSPSRGTMSPVSIKTTSPLRRFSACSGNQVEPWKTLLTGSLNFFAQVLFLSPRSDAACACARPSAMASAKLANSTVNHSHTATLKVKPAEPLVAPVGLLPPCSA